MFSDLVDGRNLRGLIWTSRVSTALFVAVMLALFALFGPFAELAIVLVVPALVTGLGTRLLRRRRPEGAAVTFTAIAPCAALTVVAPEGHAYDAPVGATGGVLFILCCMLLIFTAGAARATPRGGASGGAVALMSSSAYAAGLVTFVLALMLGKNFAPGWMAPAAATAAGLFAVVAAAACARLRHVRAGAVFLVLALLQPGVGIAGVAIAEAGNERVIPTVAPTMAPSVVVSPARPGSSPSAHHCACYSGGRCPCPGG